MKGNDLQAVKRDLSNVLKCFKSEACKSFVIVAIGSGSLNLSEHFIDMCIERCLYSIFFTIVGLMFISI